MCRLFNVTGDVQGVFFRATTQAVAERLGVNGHAVNLLDGSVEVRACGDDAAIEELSRWLHEGPRMASVAGVAESDTSCSSPGTFSIG